MKHTRILPIKGDQLTIDSIPPLLCPLRVGDSVEIRRDGDLFGCYGVVRRICGDRVWVGLKKGSKGELYQRIELALIHRPTRNK